MIESLNRLARAMNDTVSIRTVAAPLNRTTLGSLMLDDRAYLLIPVRLNSVNAVEVESGYYQYQYGFVQQIDDPDTGIYSDYVEGIVGDGVTTYATEVNNHYVIYPLTAGTSAPAGTGPLVWLRFNGVTAGLNVYEFEWNWQPEIVILNTDTPNSDGLYDASIQRYDPETQAWNTTVDIWLADANSSSSGGGFGGSLTIGTTPISGGEGVLINDGGVLQVVGNVYSGTLGG